MSDEKKNQQKQDQQGQQAQQGDKGNKEKQAPDFDIDQSLDMDVLEQVSGGHRRPG